MIKGIFMKYFAPPSQPYHSDSIRYDKSDENEIKVRDFSSFLL